MYDVLSTKQYDVKSPDIVGAFYELLKFASNWKPDQRAK